MDNWQHRSDRMWCRTCMWWVAKDTYEEERDKEPVKTTRLRLGRCRRHAPTLGGYPATFETDWCGDHKLDEAKS